MAVKSVACSYRCAAATSFRYHAGDGDTRRRLEELCRSNYLDARWQNPAHRNGATLEERGGDQEGRRGFGSHSAGVCVCVHPYRCTCVCVFASAKCPSSDDGSLCRIAPRNRFLLRPNIGCPPIITRIATIQNEVCRAYATTACVR